MEPKSILILLAMNLVLFTNILAIPLNTHVVSNLDMGEELLLRGIRQEFHQKCVITGYKFKDKCFTIPGSRRKICQTHTKVLKECT